MQENQKQELTEKLTAYIQELDHLTEMIKTSNFPSADAELIYAEVSERLKEILRASE